MKTITIINILVFISFIFCFSKTAPGPSINLEPPPAVYNAFRTSRDSYGNPVPPYVATNAENEDNKSILNAEGFKFQIPSYASGITEIRKPTNELLPPLTASEVPINALQTPTVIHPPIDLLPPLEDDKNSNNQKDVVTNEITEKFSQVTTLKPDSEDKTNNGNKEPHEKKKYEGEKYTGGFGGPPGILGEQKEKGYAIKEKEELEKAELESKSTTTEKPEEEQHTELVEPVTLEPLEKIPETSVFSLTPTPSSLFNSVFSSTIPPFDSADVTNPSVTQVPLTASPSSNKEELTKQPHGTEREAIIPLSEDNNPTSVVGISSTEFSPIQQPLQTFTIPRFNFETSEISEKPSSTTQKSVVLISPPSFSASPISTLPELNSVPTFSSVSFQQSNPPFNTPLQVPIPSLTFLPPFQSDFSHSFQQGYQPIQSPFGSSNPTQSSIAERFDNTKNPVIPSFNTLTHPQSNVYSSKPAPIPGPQLTSSIPSFVDVPGKYTGRFGGAPGILGNQAKPGYAVQPDGSIKDPDQAYKPPLVVSTSAPTIATTTTTHAPVSKTPINFEKYTGGFGGPPGILSPYDNKH